ncbi:putative MFS family arabinose efflux permease [Alteromonadaceae bacterium 2753L.S.0a.02]|nr:putative MFS family arabinose efflux permease [Alteromonadaceae bacterium 2753L.S.0a.02]
MTQKLSDNHPVNWPPLAATAALLGAGQTALLVCLPALADSTGLDSHELAVLVAGAGALFLVGTPFWGWMSDRFGRRLILWVGISGFCVSQAATAAVLLSEATELFWKLLVCRLIYGITASAIYPVTQSWLCDHPLQHHEISVAARLTRLSAAVNIGRVMGPLLSVLLLWFSPAAVLLALAVLALPLPFFYRTRSTNIAITPSEISHSKITSAAHPNAPSKPLVLLLAVLCYAIVMGVLQYALGFVLRSHSGDGINASLSAAGVLVGTSLLVAVLQLRVYSRIRHPWRRAVPLACIAISCGALLPLLFPTVTSLLLSCLLTAAGVACVMPAALATAGLHGSHRGRLSGYFAAATSGGQSVGAWLAGGLLLFGPNSIFIAMALLSVPPAALLFYHRFSQSSSIRARKGAPFLVSR